MWADQESVAAAAGVPVHVAFVTISAAEYSPVTRVKTLHYHIAFGLLYFRLPPLFLLKTCYTPPSCVTTGDSWRMARHISGV